MTKIMSVYLNKQEHELLTALQKHLGFTEESKVVKAGLVALANGQSGEHNGHDLRVEIPLQMRLNGLVRECFNEVDCELKEQRKQDVLKEMERKAAAERDKEISDMAEGIVKHIGG